MISIRTARVAAALALAAAVPPPTVSSALDIETVLREVAAANPELAARRSMVRAARHRIGPAGAWDAPMAEIGVMNVPTSGRFDMEPMTMKTVSLSQRVPLFGGNGLARRAARAHLESESAAAEMAHFEAYGMAWEAYADAHYAGALARLADDQQAVMDRLVGSARARYEAGSGRLEDVLRAESERARTRADLAAFRADERAARARLSALRGRPPGGADEPLAPPARAAVPPDPAPWLAAVEDAHPMLRALDARAERYRWAARSARRKAWPDLVVGGSYGRREPLASGAAQDDMFGAMVGIMLPVFAAQAELAEGSEMDAMARATEAERRAMELDLRQQVLGIHAAAGAAERTVGLMADTVVVVQRRAVEASWSAYGVGATDLWRVFEATHALYQEEIALLRARRDLARAEARLLSVTGRGDLLGVAVPAAKGNQP